MRDLDQDELIDRWTLGDAERELVSGKRGATRLGFALLLRFYTERGRFPRGRGEIPDAAVEYIARQVGVTPTHIAFYEWSGRTIEYHRAQICFPISACPRCRCTTRPPCLRRLRSSQTAMPPRRR
jgi:Domain of unknown function (DUF4158)